MNEPLPPSTGDQTYQPVSGFALGGLFLSGLFAAFVLVSAGVGVVKGAPIFFPMWLLLLPISGFILCVIGRNQILTSEGTRAGLPLTRWGMGLALFSGLGYAAYSITVGFAVASQANEFITGPAEPDSGFLPHLMRAGKNPTDLDIAFLLTRPASGRIKLRDAETFRNTYDQTGMDGGAGELTRFRTQVLTRMIVRGGDETVIEPLGVREWSHDKGSYKVGRNYRITTPEATLDVVLQAESTEPDAEGQRRQWFINLVRSPILSKSLTPVGKAVETLRDQARQYFEGDWRVKMLAGEFKKTPPRDGSDWKKLFPDTPDNVKGGKNITRETFHEKFNEVLAGDVRQLSPAFDAASWPIWDRDSQGRFQIEQPIRITLMGPGNSPPLVGEGIAKMRTRQAYDPGKSTPGMLVDWDVEELAVTRLKPMKGP